jgi:hypothetical protein
MLPFLRIYVKSSYPLERQTRFFLIHSIKVADRRLSEKDGPRIVNDDSVQTRAIGQITMQPQFQDTYSKAHIFVAAMRLCEHCNGTPPTIEDICKTTSFSMEQANFLSRKLEELGVISVIEGSYRIRLFIQDHLKIEDIPQQEEGSKLEEELKKFQDSQKKLSQKIESFQVEQAEKKKNLFAEMDKKLKAELNKK